MSIKAQRTAIQGQAARQTGTAAYSLHPLHYRKDLAGTQHHVFTSIELSAQAYRYPAPNICRRNIQHAIPYGHIAGSNCSGQILGTGTGFNKLQPGAQGALIGILLAGIHIDHQRCIARGRRTRIAAQLGSIHALAGVYIAVLIAHKALNRGIVGIHRQRCNGIGVCPAERDDGILSRRIAGKLNKGTVGTGRIVAVARQRNRAGEAAIALQDEAGSIVVGGIGVPVELALAGEAVDIPDCLPGALIERDL